MARRRLPSAIASGVGFDLTRSFPGAPLFDPRRWPGATVHEKALAYAEAVAPTLGHLVPGPLAWAAYATAEGPNIRRRISARINSEEIE